jgi:hypothetical protein
MKASKEWGNVYVSGDVYVEGFLGLSWAPSDKAKRNRDRYEDMVLSILTKFAQQRSSHALMAAIIKKWPKKIVISPLPAPLLPRRQPHRAHLAGLL